MSPARLMGYNVTNVIRTGEDCWKKPLCLVYFWTPEVFVSSEGKISQTRFVASWPLLTLALSPCLFEKIRSSNSSLKGTFHQDLQTGALTISSISTCQCSFGEGRFPKPSRGAGVQCAAMPLFSKMAAGSRRWLRRREVLSEEA